MFLPRRESDQKFLVKSTQLNLTRLKSTHLNLTPPLVLDSGWEWLHEVAIGEDNNRHACYVRHDGHSHHVVKEKERKYLENFFYHRQVI